MPKARSSKRSTLSKPVKKKEPDVKIEQIEEVRAHGVHGQAAHAEFRQAVWNACLQVPNARVTTYGHIARMVGHPTHARLVGSVLKNGGWSEGQVPWHRIINASGKVPLREARGQVDDQAQLLQHEGVHVGRDSFHQYTISLNRYGWFELP